MTFSTLIGISGQLYIAIIIAMLVGKFASQQAQNIAQGTLKRICGVLRAPFPPQTTDALMGKPMLVTVGVEEFTSNTTGNVLKSNKIKNYAPIPSVTSTPPAAVQGW